MPAILPTLRMSPRLRSPLLRLALTYGAAFLVVFLLLGLAGYLTLSSIT